MADKIPISPQSVNDDDSSESSRRSIMPFYTEREVLRAAEQFVSLKTPPAQKRKLLSRILISYEHAAKAAPILIDAIHRADIQTRHTLLDFFADLIVRGRDLSCIAESLSRMLGDQNFALREKVAKILIKMGPDAASAALRTIGFLRHKMPDIPLNAIKILTAIGPVCAQTAIPKVEQLIKANPTGELKEAAQLCLEVLYGEVKLPTKEENQRKAQELIEEEIANSYTNIRGKTIMVADDDKEIRKMISKALIRYGAIITEAETGVQAAEAIKDNKNIDLIVLDLMMPEMTGAEFLHMLREEYKMKNTPVYIVSARTERSILMAMAKLEVAGYFMKPFKIQEILSRVNASLGN